jgi:predicted transcriptional regulator
MFKRLDEIAARTYTNRSQVMRRLIAEGLERETPQAEAV